MKIAMSSGHGKYISGAVGPSPWGLNEHAEAVKVVNQTATDLHEMGVGVVTFEDTTSRDQNTNLRTIVDWHNRQTRDIDVSVHFNSNGTTDAPRGCMVLYVSEAGKSYAIPTVNAICAASGLKNLGPVKRTNLYFLNNTNKPAILIETCFVNSSADVDIYHAKFAQICEAIASGISGSSAPIPPEPTPPEALFSDSGKCSWFGGPNDTGVSPSEGLAFIYSYDARPDLFLVQQPPGTTGLARRLNADGVHYVAVRWDYNRTPKTMLASKDQQALVRATKTGRELLAWPADWGPHTDTGRIADLSPLLMSDLGIKTDDEVVVIYPAPDEPAPEPEPEPETSAEVNITTKGHVKVTLNGVIVEGEAP